MGRAHRVCIGITLAGMLSGGLACDPFPPPQSPASRAARRSATTSVAQGQREAFIRRMLARAAQRARKRTGYRAVYRGESGGRALELQVSYRAPGLYRVEHSQTGEILLLDQTHYQWVQVKSRRIVRYPLRPLAAFLRTLQGRVLSLLVSPGGGPAVGASAFVLRPRFSIRARSKAVKPEILFDGRSKPPFWVSLLRTVPGVSMARQGAHRVFTLPGRRLRFDTKRGLLVGEARLRADGTVASQWRLQRLEKSPRFPPGHFRGADLKGFAVVERPLPPAERERLVRAALAEFEARCVAQLARIWTGAPPARRRAIRAALGSFYTGLLKGWFDELFSRSTLSILRGPDACKSINHSFRSTGLLRKLRAAPDPQRLARKLAEGFARVLAQKVQGFFQQGLKPKLAATLAQVETLLGRQRMLTDAQRRSILGLYRETLARAVAAPHHRAQAPRLVPIILGCLTRVLPAPRPKRPSRP